MAEATDTSTRPEVHRETARLAELHARWHALMAVADTEPWYRMTTRGPDYEESRKRSQEFVNEAHEAFVAASGLPVSTRADAATMLRFTIESIGRDHEQFRDAILCGDEDEIYAMLHRVLAWLEAKP